MDYNRSGHQTGLRIEVVIDWKLFLSIPFGAVIRHLLI